MKKRILSLLCVLALCLGLLPTTALAAGEDAPAKLYVGNQAVIVANTVTYWTTDNSGGLRRVDDATDDSNDWTVRYNPNTATLTLRNATIKTTHDNSQGAVIYAESRSSNAVSLTIELEGTNTIDSASYGIFVNAEMSNDSYGTSASLTITGEGSLDVSGSYYGIYVKSGSGDASLTIEEASVNVNTTLSYGNNHGVHVMSGTYATSSPVLSLAVNGGSLTTSGSASGEGIKFYVGASGANSATTSLTVTGNAIVDARTGGISATGVNITPEFNIGSTDSIGGIVFDGTEGTVYGDVTLDEPLTVGEGETLTVPEGSALNTNGNLTNNGTIVDAGGTLTGELGGTIVTAPAIITESLPDGTAGQSYTATLEATGNNITWSVTDGTLPEGLTLNESTGEITPAPLPRRGNSPSKSPPPTTSAASTEHIH